MDTKDLTLSIGLLFGRHFCDSESMHYGYWADDLEVSLANIEVFGQALPPIPRFELETLKKITEKKLRQIAIIRNHKQQIQRFREFLKSYTAIIEPNQD